ncbi:MAG: class I SAM-dependent methyltransferase [Candidatus Omnitrophica bacterium]|nr:class I SAM-dependent methyltransferase [Candidatus Omnitrophota bacterium]
MDNNEEKYYLPDKDSVFSDKKCPEKWYGNLLLETSQDDYPEWMSKLLHDTRNYYGKYFSKKSREFFLHHFAGNLTKTLDYFYGSQKKDLRFLEIGCGCGNQVLLMALLGANVVGCDIREDVCALVEKRKQFYEKIIERELNLKIMCRDIMKINTDELDKFDAINFLFAFNDIKPNEKLLELVGKLLKPGGRLVLQETNPGNYYNRIFRRRNALSPYKIARILKKHGFKISSLKGGYALPPAFWRFIPGNILSVVDSFLCRSLFLSVSYRLMAEKM